MFRVKEIVTRRDDPSQYEIVKFRGNFYYLKDLNRRDRIIVEHVSLLQRANISTLSVWEWLNTKKQQV